MCHICIEGCIASILSENHGPEQGFDIGGAAYIQSVPDFKYATLLYKKYYRGSTLTQHNLFYKLIDEVLSENSANNFALLSEAIGDTQTSVFLKTIFDRKLKAISKNLNYCPFPLHNRRIFTNKNYLHSVLNNSPTLRNWSVKILSDFSDCSTSHNETEYDNFPPESLLFALNYLIKKCQFEEVIQKIALGNWDCYTDLYHLWIVRKSFAACTAHYGVDFVINNLQYAREATIIETIFHVPMSHDDFNLVHEAYLGKDPDHVMSTVLKNAYTRKILAWMKG